LFFINRFFHPDHSATSQLVSDLAFHLADSGREVHVVTSQQRYEDPESRLAPNEIVHGVHVHRVPTTHFGRSALTGRAADYFSFYLSAWRQLSRLLAADDVVVAKTDPPLVSVVAMLAAQQKSAHLVNWLQDIYPEVAANLGLSIFRGPLGGTLSYVRDKTLKKAVANVVVGERMRERLVSRGIPANTLHVIHNWSNDEQISQVDPADNPLRRQWGLDGKFVVGYSGNLGRAHEFDTVLEASELLRHDPRIVFAFIGGGQRMEELARIVGARDLDHMFRFIPYQDRELLKYSLAVPDIHWVSLKPAVEGMIVPSKFYGIAAAGRPVIAITASDGEIARLVREHECGVVVEPDRAKALAEVILRLSADASLVSRMGARARAMLDKSFTRQQAYEHWRHVLDRVGQRAAMQVVIETRSAGDDF
jgi:colanic acid biosynthesis glycosyl transferase WcaI